MFPDPRASDVEARGRQIFAEDSVGEGALQLRLPRVKVFSRVSVHRLIVTPMEVVIADGVPDQTAPQAPCMGPGARTITASSAATLSIPVNSDVERTSGFARVRAKLTVNTCATYTG